AHLYELPASQRRKVLRALGDCLNPIGSVLGNALENGEEKFARLIAGRRGDQEGEEARCIAFVQDLLGQAAFSSAANAGNSHDRGGTLLDPVDDAIGFPFLIEVGPAAGAKTEIGLVDRLSGRRRGTFHKQAPPSSTNTLTIVRRQRNTKCELLHTEAPL